jgi:hypothetical protein
VLGIVLDLRRDYDGHGDSNVYSKLGFRSCFGDVRRSEVARMSWQWVQASGAFSDPAGIQNWIGYSGQPPHTNDTASEGLEGLGPIPRGKWQGVELIEDSPKLGPYIIRLEPYPETNTLGRSGFFMHGERANPPPGFASDGCLILERAAREAFWTSEDHDIEVV